jgi:osmotically-inducible protein OsmY
MRGRSVIWMASGAMVAAGLAACGDDPPVTPAGKGAAQALSRPAELTSAAPTAADENASLASRVTAALRRDSAVGHLGIDVVSVAGTVTLFGTAPTVSDREKAARVAAGVDGVRSVLNNLVIVAGS